MKGFKIFRIVMLVVLASILFSFYQNRNVTVIYLVRHAEKLNMTDTSGLTVAGLQRSLVLSDSMKNKNLTRIYASIYLRAQVTAQATATKSGLFVNPYHPDSSALFVSRLKKLKNQRILIVGHSDNIPNMIRELSGEQIEIPSKVYDRLYKITITRLFKTTVRVECQRYGMPTP